MRKILFGIVFPLLFCACASGKKKSVQSILDDFETVEVEDASDEVEVPFMVSGGVKYVNATINGVGIHDMIFDTGCGRTLISLSEARELYRKGRLSEDDFTGTELASIADGSIVENMGVVLKEVVVGGKVVIKDVRATISSSVNAPLLLGNSINDRFSSITIDNEKNVMIFKE